MHIDFFGCKPFDTVGKTEDSLKGTECAQCGAHFGPGVRPGCQARIVMRFSIVGHEALTF